MNNAEAIIRVSTMDDIEKITSNTKYINVSIDSFDDGLIRYFLEHGKNYLYADSISDRNGFIYVNHNIFKNGEMILQKIIKDIPKDLTTLEKVRYIYVNLGKILSVDINTIDDKNEKISFNSISTINNIWGALASGKITDESIAKIFMYLCCRLNIKCELISNNINGHIGNKIYIDNSYVIVDLYNDLHNIQGGFITTCFDKYNNDKEIDKKIGYIEKDYTDKLIDNELKKLDYISEDIVSTILFVTEKHLNIKNIGVVELSKIYKNIFDKYCPNYDIRINNLYLVDNFNKDHFIIISYNDKYYSYNYSKGCFTNIDYSTIYDNFKSNKIGIYENESFNFIEGSVLS